MKKITVLRLMLLLFLMVAPFTSVLIPFCKADGEIIDHYNLVGNNGRIDCAIYVYRDTDSMTTEDFYALKIRIHAKNDDPANMFDTVILKISSPQAICDLWEPTSGWKGESTIGISYFHISFSIWIPTEYVEFTGGFTNNIKWLKCVVFDTSITDLGACFWVPEGAGFDFTFDLTVLHVQESSFWKDYILFSPSPNILKIQKYGSGTTTPSPGTHSYNYGTQVTVTAIPTARYIFSYWVLDGVKIYSNPITVKMNIDHTLEAHFRIRYGYGGGGGCGKLPTLQLL